MSTQHNNCLQLSVIIILLASTSFLLGGLAIRFHYTQEEGKSGGGDVHLTPISPENSPAEGVERVYTSSQGKRYYPWWCEAGSSISPKNIVWFDTPEEAEEAGYTVAQRCG